MQKEEEEFEAQRRAEVAKTLAMLDGLEAQRKAEDDAYIQRTHARQDARAEGRDLWEEAKAKAMAAGKPVRRTEL